MSHSGGFGLSGSIDAFCRDGWSGLRIASPILDDSSRMSSRLSFRLRRSHGAKPPDGSGSTATGAAAGAWSGGAAERHMMRTGPLAKCARTPGAKQRTAASASAQICAGAQAFFQICVLCVCLAG